MEETWPGCLRRRPGSPPLLPTLLTPVVPLLLVPDCSLEMAEPDGDAERPQEGAIDRWPDMLENFSYAEVSAQRRGDDRRWINRELSVSHEADSGYPWNYPNLEAFMRQVGWHRGADERNPIQQWHHMVRIAKNYQELYEPPGGTSGAHTKWNGSTSGSIMVGDPLHLPLSQEFSSSAWISTGPESQY